MVENGHNLKIFATIVESVEILMMNFHVRRAINNKTVDADRRMNGIEKGDGMSIRK
jgi:hypothetical protein